MAIVTSLKDAEALAAAAAERVTSLIEASIAARQGASLCLAGGQTPRRLYELLADASRPWRSRIDWTRAQVYWTDERHVPPDHAESNYRMAYRALLSHVPVPSTQVHRMRGELPAAADAAREYEIVLSRYRGPQPFDKLWTAPSSVEGQGSAPIFDLVLLGVGEDAHIASIFPGSPLLDPTTNLAAAVWVEHLNAWRITLTPATLLDARAIVVLASGSNKTDAVRAALNGREDVTRWPAQLLRAAGDRVEWLIDSAAAGPPASPPS